MCKFYHLFQLRRLYLMLITLASWESLASAQILFDGALGTLPEAQGWTYLALGAATQSPVDDSISLDSTLMSATQAGYSRLAPGPLARQAGVTLLFSVQLTQETHNNLNRAGFSVLMLGDDKRGIELGFWTNTIFAQADAPLFTHAEDVAFPTGAGRVDYALSLFATNYVLRANGAIILSGPIRDYTAFNGLINPYRTPNFIFLGDDTTSASANILLRQVTLVWPALLRVVSGSEICWSCVSNLAYTVQGSTNLHDWSTLGSVQSGSGDCGFTNSLASSQQFFRVMFP